MRRAIVLVLSVLPLFLATAGAQVMYFTGALAYTSDSSGNNVGGAWEYDTFAGTPNSKFSFNGTMDFALPLNLGTNSFSVSGAGGTAAPYIGIGLYFSATANPFSGPQDAAPNLAILDHGNAGTVFAFAANGAQVSTYGQFSAVVAYSGVTSFSTGGYQVTATAFDYDAGSTFGTLSLSVIAIPEPSTIAFLGVGLAIVGVCARRGRRVE